MLQVEHLIKTYGTQNAVDNISFEAKKGEILGFLGPNGAGKSTTMKIATCYLPPTSGKVSVCGFDVTKQSKEVRKNVGYLPEHNPLYLDMYVHEYLRFIASLHKVENKNTRVSEMVELVGLTKEQNKKIGALSKGYRQRVGLAQALIHQPQVLILDEPTTGLDPNQIVEIRNVIRNISQEKTVIFSTHIMQEVQALCNRVIIINQGKIVANNDVNSLKINQQEILVSVEFSQAINPSLFEKIEGVKNIKVINAKQLEITSENTIDIRPEISKIAQQNNLILLGMNRQEVSLERVFQDLTKK